MVTYLSEPLVRGYTTGSACHVCISQLKYLFGVKPERFTGPLSLIYVSTLGLQLRTTFIINSSAKYFTTERSFSLQNGEECPSQFLKIQGL